MKVDSGFKPRAENDFGIIELRLDEVIQESGLSKSKVAYKAELQRTQLNAYLNGDVKRMDFAVMSRICYALNCELSSILRYIPPKNDSSNVDSETSAPAATNAPVETNVLAATNAPAAINILAATNACAPASTRDAVSLVADKADEDSFVAQGLVEEEKA